MFVKLFPGINIHESIYSPLGVLNIFVKLILPPAYEKKYLNRERILPVIDNNIFRLFKRLETTGFMPADKNFPIVEGGENIFQRFKDTFETHLLSSKFNLIQGLELFKQRDICLGCTQYIDNIYIHHSQVQVLENEYKYHSRLGVSKSVTDLIPNTPLIISIPNVNGKDLIYSKLFDECLYKNIPVHIDCAWYTASSHLVIDLTHDAIASVGFSMSKGYGTGFNRVGLRYSRNKIQDSISLQNDFQMMHSIPIQIGLYFLDNLAPDHLWNVYKDRYVKLCEDFDLVPTRSIHLALDGEYNVGVAELLHYTEFS